MRTSIKLLALLLAMVMTCSVLLACSSGGGDTSGDASSAGTPSGNTSGTPVGPDSPYAELPEGLRFDGDGEKPEIRFIVADDIGAGYNLAGRSIDVDDTEDAADTVNVTILQRNKIVEDTLGVDIVLLDTVGLMSMASTIQPSLLGGSDDYDVVGAYQYYAPGLVLGDNAGFMLNYNTLVEEDNFLNFNKPYWNGELFNEMSYKGAGYFVTGDLSLSYVGGMYVTFVNARIWDLYKDFIKEETGYETVYDVVTNYKWTLDFMTKLVDKVWVDENHNDKPDKGDQVGFMVLSGDSNVGLDGMYAGCNLRYTKWVDGEPTLGVNNERTYDIAEKLYRLYFESKAMNDSDSDKYIMEDFADGNCLFVVNRLYTSELYLRDMADDYIICPCPMLNEEQHHYYSTLHDGFTLFAIPYTNSKLPATTATLELMASESYRLVTPAYYEIALKTKYTRGDVNQAGAMIDIVHDNVYTDFVALYTERLGGVTMVFRTGLNKRFASTVRSHEKVWSRGVQNLLDALTESIAIDLR